MSCSIVPISHSLAMVREVDIAARIIITTAIKPGTIKFALRRSGLYQIRGFTSIGRLPTLRIAPCLFNFSRMMFDEKIWTILEI